MHPLAGALKVVQRPGRQEERALMQALSAVGAAVGFVAVLIIGAIAFFALWFALMGGTKHKNRIIRVMSQAIMYPILAVSMVFLVYVLLVGGGSSDPDEPYYHRPP